MANVPFVIYDSAGSILQHGYCPEEDLARQASTGRTVLQGGGTHDKHYVLDGQIVAYTEAELQAKSNLAHGWAWKMPERIALDTRALADAKAQAWERIKAARDAAEAVPFVCDGATYDSDKERIAGAVQLALLAQLANQPFSINWTLANNTAKTLDGHAMLAVGTALGQHVSAVFATGRALRDQIEAATTIAQLDALGWPA